MSVARKPTPDLYETDFAQWSERQASLLLARRFAELDLENVAEEIQSLTRSDRHALESQLVRLLAHMLKWRFQPERRSRSWTLTIYDARRQIGRILRDSPSLRPFFVSVWDEAYGDGRKIAAIETRRPENAFPNACPFTVEQVLDPDFQPDWGQP